MVRVLEGVRGAQDQECAGGGRDGAQGVPAVGRQHASLMPFLGAHRSLQSTPSPL